MLNDLRYGMRTLLGNPGFSIAAIIALALGIGANTAIFSCADAFLFKPLPLPGIQRMLVLFEQPPGRSADWNAVAPANYLDWTRQSRSFQSLAAYDWTDFNLSGQGDPERVLGARVSRDFFSTLGVKAALGRTFFPEENEPGRERATVLGYALWQRRFAADPTIVGKTMKIDSKSCTIIGVMPKDFHFPMPAELWTPLALTSTQQAVRDGYFLQVIGRLHDGVSEQQARAEMQTIAGRLAEAYPKTNKGWGVRVVPFRQFLSGELTYQYTLMLMAAVGFVLLIACANVANLQFARAGRRQKEFAVRTALGASRFRVIRQLLTESVLMSLVAAGLGWLLGAWGVDLILSYMPPEVARFVGGWDQLRMDTRAFFFTVVVAVLAGVISGLAPALASSRPDLNETLKEGARGASAGSARARLRSILLVGEVALALVLLVGAGLMVRGVRALLNANDNFAPASLLTMQTSLPDSRYKEPHEIVRFYDESLRILETTPGVTSAAIATSVPYGNLSHRDFIIEGRQAPAPGELQLALIQNISPNYFQLMHIALRQGRAFSRFDGPDSPPVAIVGESLARRYFPGENALGRRIRFAKANPNEPWLTIVGVVEDVRYSWFDRNPAPALYRPYRQAPQPFTYFTLRTTGDPLQLVTAVRKQMTSLDSELPLFEIKTLDRVIYQSVLGLSYVAVMMTVLGVIALVLACVGVYAVMAYGVSERTREIGIRMALGAERGGVLRMVMGRGMLITGIGLLIGFAISFPVARVLSSLIYGVSSSDWQTFAGVSFALAASALTASYIPTRRASTIDPMAALRNE